MKHPPFQEIQQPHSWIITSTLTVMIKRGITLCLVTELLKMDKLEALVKLMRMRREDSRLSRTRRSATAKRLWDQSRTKEVVDPAGHLLLIPLLKELLSREESRQPKTLAKIINPSNGEVLASNTWLTAHTEKMLKTLWLKELLKMSFKTGDVMEDG